MISSATWQDLINISQHLIGCLEISFCEASRSPPIPLLHALQVRVAPLVPERAARRGAPPSGMSFGMCGLEASDPGRAPNRRGPRQIPMEPAQSVVRPRPATMSSPEGRCTCGRARGKVAGAGRSWHPAFRRTANRSIGGWGPGRGRWGGWDPHIDVIHAQGQRSQQADHRSRWHDRCERRQGTGLGSSGRTARRRLQHGMQRRVVLWQYGGAAGSRGRRERESHRRSRQAQHWRARK